MISDKIKEYMANSFPEECGEGWMPSLHSGRGEMAVYWNPSIPGINFQIWDLGEDGMKGQLSLTVLGFSGQVHADKLTLPNTHLYTQLCQLETIQNRLPMYENINDFYWEVLLARKKEKRRKRAKEKAQENDKIPLDNSKESV